MQTKLKYIILLLISALSFSVVYLWNKNQTINNKDNLVQLGSVISTENPNIHYSYLKDKNFFEES